MPMIMLRRHLVGAGPRLATAAQLAPLPGRPPAAGRTRGAPRSFPCSPAARLFITTWRCARAGAAAGRQSLWAAGLHSAGAALQAPSALPRN